MSKRPQNETEEAKEQRLAKRRLASKKYYANPENNAKRRAYEASPEVRAKRRVTEQRYRDESRYSEERRAREATAEFKARRMLIQRAARTGVTPQMFETLWQLQQGKCAICERPLTRPCADHCHDTKQPRGLLCSSCNTVEGQIKKMGLTPHSFAERLQSYLDNPPARLVELP